MSSLGLLGWGAKGAVALAAALLAARLGRGGSASLRHGVLTAGLAAALVLPALAAVLPEWAVPVDWAGWAVQDAALRAGGGPAAVSLAAPEWLPLVLAAWASGCLLFVLRGALGLAGARRMVGRAAAVEHAATLRIAEGARRAMDVRRRVRVLESAEVDVPVAWELGAAAVLLPTAARSWSEDRLRAALAHEMAHVSRGDGWSLLLARLVVALHWFDPLAWLAQRGLLREREQAADDLALAAGVPARIYARELLGIAREMKRRPGPAVAALLRGGDLERRIARVLDARGRRTRLGRRGWLVVGAAALGSTAALAMAEGTRSPTPGGGAALTAGVARDRARADERTAALWSSWRAVRPVAAGASDRPESSGGHAERALRHSAESPVALDSRAAADQRAAGYWPGRPERVRP